MSATLNDLLNLYVFPRGRREYALSEVARLARERGHDALAEHCDKAKAQAQRTREIHRQLQTARARGANPRLAELDNTADRTLTALHQVPETTGRAMGGEAEATAQAFLDAAFPEGVAAITSLPWAEQLTESKALLRLLDGDQRAAVEQFRLEELVELLRGTVLEIEVEMGRSAPPEVSSKDIRARDAAGQDMLLEAVAMIIGLHPRATLADTRARTTLMHPILVQSEQLRQSRRRRQIPTDVDPTTGEPLDTPPDLDGEGGQPDPEEG